MKRPSQWLGFMLLISKALANVCVSSLEGTWPMAKKGLEHGVRSPEEEVLGEVL